MKCECGKKLSRIKRFYITYFTKRVVYTVAVVSEDGESIIETFPVCTRCGMFYESLSEMYKKYGLKAIMERLYETE